jgi:hypothetical protein
MRSVHFKSLIVSAALAGCLAAGAIRAQEDVKVTHTALKAGDVAPDYRGKKNVVLAFYVLAFTEG